MGTLDEQITTLQLRLSQLKLRQQRIDARKRALLQTRERKQETRRQVLVGALVLAKIRAGQMDGEPLREWLDATLSRPADRALFDLPPLDPAA